MSKYGFTEQEWKELYNLFKKNPKIEKVILFGSRAKNSFKPMSDVDIVLSGKAINYSLIAKLQSELEESQLPYFFDVLNEHNITSDELKHHIKSYGKIIYQKK